MLLNMKIFFKLTVINIVDAIRLQVVCILNI